MTHNSFLQRQKIRYRSQHRGHLDYLGFQGFDTHLHSFKKIEMSVCTVKKMSIRVQTLLLLSKSIITLIYLVSSIFFNIAHACSYASKYVLKEWYEETLIRVQTPIFRKIEDTKYLRDITHFDIRVCSTYRFRTVVLVRYHFSFWSASEVVRKQLSKMTADSYRNNHFSGQRHVF